MLNKVLFQAIFLMFPLMFAKAATSVEGYDIIIVAGQSNASGRGMGPAGKKLKNPAVDPLIFQVGRYKKDNFKIVKATDILQNWDYSPSGDKIGGTMVFARLYAQNFLTPERRVLIIPAAQGGTSLKQWSAQNSVLHKDMMDRVHFALNLPGKNRIVALLWHQGEGDVKGIFTQDKDFYPSIDSYGLALSAFFQRIRDEVPNQQFPILVAEFVPSWLADGKDDPKLLKLKNDFQERIFHQIQSWVPNSDWASSAGLLSNYKDPQVDRGWLTGPGHSENIHFSATGQIGLGKRYFEKYKVLKAGN